MPGGETAASVPQDPPTALDHRSRVDGIESQSVERGGDLGGRPGPAGREDLMAEAALRGRPEVVEEVEGGSTDQTAAAEAGTTTWGVAVSHGVVRSGSSPQPRLLRHLPARSTPPASVSGR